MHMIGHETGRDQPGAAQIALEHVAVFGIVAVIGEEPDAGARPLHHVMRHIRDDDAGEPGHVLSRS